MKANLSSVRIVASTIIEKYVYVFDLSVYIYMVICALTCITRFENKRHKKNDSHMLRKFHAAHPILKLLRLASIAVLQDQHRKFSNTKLSTNGNCLTYIFMILNFFKLHQMLLKPLKVIIAIWFC